ncbi:MAG: hypothetical protein GWN81_20505, partial [Phycisphaerae bacterium]|nr:hypothetical protein [Phycisphaerae bacterium]NIP54883.1 hypothetical protein [Phycisphaerae bacterium]NIU11169.1 hypothetical protein [Phycisphaerae bacterium]NIX01254.1 hypothetical protein [Phycisphaerae bacterium]NIX30934.1 hypothetical protein [Phycisphaerae bacterium]
GAEKRIILGGFGGPLLLDKGGGIGIEVGEGEVSFGGLDNQLDFLDRYALGGGLFQ